MEKKILIIEDEIEISKIVKKYLEKNGYEVFIAENGFSGLKIFVGSVGVPGSPKGEGTVRYQ